MRTQRAQNRTVPADGDARERLPARAPATQRRLSLSGASTALLEAGAGPPLVLHGQGGFAGSWWSAIPGLATTHHVIARQPQAFLQALRLVLQRPSTDEATRS